MPVAPAPLPLGLAERVARAAKASAAFVSGSLAAGLGNAGSDLDVYLVYDDGESRREQLFTASGRVDVHHLSREALAQPVDQVLDVRLLARGSGAGQFVTEEHVRLCAALVQATVIMDDGRVASLQNRLTDANHLVCRAVINHWLLIGVSCHEDWLALRDSDDPDDVDAAIYTARTALLAGCKALTAASGDLHFGPKWLPHQLSRSAPSGFPREELRRLSGAGLDPARSSALSQGLMGFAQTCAAVAGTVGWQGMDMGGWPSWRQGSGVLQRDERFAMRAYDDGAVLIGPGKRHVHLQPDVALVWALCNGITPQGLESYAARVGNKCPTYGGLTPKRCQELVRRLVDAGLLHDTATPRAVP